MPEKGQLPAYRRWAHRLLGADSDLPATVINQTAAQFIGLRMSLKPIDSMRWRVTITPSVR
jgi:hypothetical protein